MVHAFLLVGLALSALAQDERDMQVFGTVAESWRTNRESFRSFSCRFTWRVGYAKSLDAALRGDLEDPITNEGLWVVDGPLVRYELLCNPALVDSALDRARQESTKSGGSRTRGWQVKLPCNPTYFLKNEGFRARQSKIISAMNLIPNDHIDEAGIRVTPFALDLMGADEASNPAVFLQGVVERRYIGQYGGVTDLRGTPVLNVTIGSRAGTFQRGYLFDPEQGYLPLHFWESDPQSGRKRFDAHIVEAKNCAEHRWFPMRAVVIFGDFDVPGRKRVREMKVTELDVDHRPDPKLFRLDVPAGTQVTVINSHYYVNIEKNEKIYANQLADLYRRCVEHGEEMRRTDEFMRRAAGSSRTGSGIPPWVIIANVSIVAVIGSIFARRLIRSRSRG